MKRDYVLVFGAAVRPNGRPSASLRRRIRSAATWAKLHPTAIIIPTGAAGENGLAEARVMKKALIESGVPASRIVMELKGQDTLQSVRFCDEVIKRRGDCDRVICCTSRYHQPRCALLLKMLGYRVVLPRVAIVRGQLSWFGFARLFLREIAALPYDALLLMARRGSTSA
jgi:vancomycin permeability regulator SanA